jgi:hypothetical protein
MKQLPGLPTIPLVEDNIDDHEAAMRSISITRSIGARPAKTRWTTSGTKETTPGSPAARLPP